MNKKHKLKGSTLVESLTALVIVSAVMGAAFTLYEKTVEKQQLVMHTRAKFIQAAVEYQIQNHLPLPDYSDDFVNVDVRSENFRQQSDMKHYTLTVYSINGKTIMTKNYLEYQVP